MNNSTEFDLQAEQDVQTVAESADISLSAIELDLVGGGGTISLFI